MSQAFIVIFKPNVILKSNRGQPSLNEMIAENPQKLAKVMASDDRGKIIFNRLNTAF